MIACIRLPHFPATIEQRDRSELSGLPIGVGEPPQAPQSVYSVSIEAADQGVRAGMSLRQAQSLCSDLQIIPARHSHYEREFERLLEVLTRFSTHIEPEDTLILHADARRRRIISAYLVAPQMDEHPSATCYLDLGKLNHEALQEVSAEIQRSVQGMLDISPAVGFASGKFPARVAAFSLTPSECLLVPEGRERDFLAPYSSALLPVDGETLRQLSLLGLHTLGHIVELPVAALFSRFGSQGRILHRLANGRDTSPVQPYQPPRREMFTHQFESPVDNWAMFDHILSVKVEHLAAGLQAPNWATNRIHLSITLENQIVLENELVLREPVMRAHSLVEACLDLAHSLPVQNHIVEVTLSFSLTRPPAARQLTFFDRQPVPQEHLRQVLEDLIARHGEEHFYRVVLTDEHHRLPERRFRVDKAKGR